MATKIDNAVIDQIRMLIPLAPTHNPANLLGIEICQQLFSRVTQVAVFDTAFHQTLPEHAYRYALPDELYTQHGIRRYGFHGTSHAYITRRVAAHLGIPDEQLNIISLHLGNGANAAAIAGGRCVDTSMGMTPLGGLIMGTRSGDIDPALIFMISQMTGKSLEQIETLLNHDSGLKGICGYNDMRKILALADTGNQKAQLAIEMFCYRIKKYIGAYFAVLGRVDAIVFTVGIGEHASVIRAKACNGLEMLGIRIHRERNLAPHEQALDEIQSDESTVKVLVAQTNEEQEIVLQTLRILENAQPA